MVMSKKANVKTGIGGKRGTGSMMVAFVRLGARTEGQSCVLRSVIPPPVVTGGDPVAPSVSPQWGTMVQRLSILYSIIIGMARGADDKRSESQTGDHIDHI